MSYDLQLFVRRVDEDPLETAHRDSGDTATTAPNPDAERLKQKIATALIAHNPQLEIFRFNYEDIATIRKISVEEAKQKYRHLELNDRESGEGIQITLFDNEASVTVPFWHQGKKAEGVFIRIWPYLEIICRESGYLVFDPQLDRVLELWKDCDEVVNCYTSVTQQIQPTVAAPPPSQRKTWWKFW